ncbi:MAG: mechanosensitive ion channel, partial [Clostridia bacterium]|nr:mechanosensitive ion channel [Clostridia bacterium]
KAEPTMVSFVDSFISIGMWVLLIILTVSTLGINTTSLAALLAAGGMAVGMALSGTLQNFAGGIMILVFKPFKVGDLIEAQGFMGTVSEVTIVSTRITTLDNRSVILPNGTLFNGNITNVNTLPLRRVEITVNVAYGSDAEKVKAAILEMIGSRPELFLDSSVSGAADPFVALRTLQDSSIEFLVRVWVRTPDFWTARFWLTESIYTRLPQEYGIHFPFPQMDVHIKQQ